MSPRQESVTITNTYQIGISQANSCGCVLPAAIACFCVSHSACTATANSSGLCSIWKKPQNFTNHSFGELRRRVYFFCQTPLGASREERPPGWRPGGRLWTGGRRCTAPQVCSPPRSTALQSPASSHSISRPSNDTKVSFNSSSQSKTVCVTVTTHVQPDPPLISPVQPTFSCNLHARIEGQGPILHSSWNVGIAPRPGYANDVPHTRYLPHC